MATKALIQMSVVVSNGHNKFILGVAAAELFALGMDVELIAAGYPMPPLQKLLTAAGFLKLPRVSRLLARKEDIPAIHVHSLWRTELLFQLARSWSALAPQSQAAAWLETRAMMQYCRDAAPIVRRTRAGLYHYRAGYGGKSVAIAKARGMVTLCDHSIAHPNTMDFLINNGGQLPTEVEVLAISKFWRHVLEDIDQADHVVVNSDFVKSTFLCQKWSSDRVHVIYNGIDDAFLRCIPEREHPRKNDAPLKFLFAGEVGKRKGAEYLFDALSRINDASWRLDLVGYIDPVLAAQFANFLEDERVTVVGTVARLELASLMAKADTFVFPSLAEGSARVIFMAMACGCHIITTVNSGSIVQDGVHGQIVPPADSYALEKAIRAAIDNRKFLYEVSVRNAKLIASEFNQRNYGLQLVALYEKLGAKVHLRPAALRAI